MSASIFPIVHDEGMRKRGTQEGSVRQKDGRWYGSYFRYVAGVNGDLEYKRKEVALDATTKRAARAELRDKYVAPANAQAAMPEGNITLRQFVEARFKPDHIGSLRKGGKIHYETQLKHILPTLGDIRLADIQPAFIQQLMTSKSQTLSSQSVRHIRNALSAILRYARDLEFIDGRLATEAVRLPRAVAEERRALTIEQAKILLAALNPKHRPVIHFMLATGCRASEAAGLRWQDVNLTDASIIADGECRYPHTVHFRHGWRFGEYAELKTKNARRNVPMTSGLWVELQTLFERRRPESETVFTFCRNEKQGAKPIDMHNFQKRVIKPLGKKLGMPWLNLHCLRHTTATWLSAAGMPMHNHLQLMGHGSLRATMHYIHPDTESQRQVVERVADMMNGKLVN